MKHPLLRLLLSVALVLGLAGLIGGAVLAAPPDTAPSTVIGLPEVEWIDGQPVRTVLSPDTIRAIDRPHLVAAEEAGLADEDPVLGVAEGGEARAYPLDLLDWREVVNDDLAGRPIAATW